MEFEYNNNIYLELAYDTSKRIANAVIL